MGLDITFRATHKFKANKCKVIGSFGKDYFIRDFFGVTPDKYLCNVEISREQLYRFLFTLMQHINKRKGIQNDISTNIVPDIEHYLYNEDVERLEEIYRWGKKIYDNFNFNKWELVIQCW
jgi:hypothetical protein